MAANGFFFFIREFKKYVRLNFNLKYRKGKQKWNKKIKQKHNETKRTEMKENKFPCSRALPHYLSTCLARLLDLDLRLYLHEKRVIHPLFIYMKRGW